MQKHYNHDTHNQPPLHRYDARQRHRVTWLTMCLGLLVLLLAACGGDTGQTGAQSTPSTPVKVNGFGTAQNHGHSMLALPGNVILMATHYGIFRSSNSGTSWSEVAAGPGQPMDGLMTYSLSSSSLDPQRVYVLTQLVTNVHKGVLGLYSSTDGGQTWKLAIASDSIGTIYTVAAGNDTAEQVYIYQNELGPLGLKVSMDGGQHFSQTGKLPFPDIKGIVALPGEKGQLVVYGNSGIAHSNDGGNTWQISSGTTGGIYAAVSNGPHRSIYASGDSGIFVSDDGGKSFKQVNNSYYSGLVANSTQAQLLYGKTGRSVYESDNGGQTWKALPGIKGNLQDLSPDPQNPAILYLSLSYPSQVYRFDQHTQQWTSLTPQA